MKRHLALLIAVGMAVPLLTAEEPKAARPAVASVADPDYGAFKNGLGGGFKIAGDTVESRCRIPGGGATVAEPPRSPDMGTAVCKHHVWKLKAADAWKAKPLAEAQSYFMGLDAAYRATLEAARGVVAAYNEAGGDAKIWDAAGAKPGPALAKYYEALFGLEKFLDGGTGKLVLPAKQPPVLANLDKLVLKALEDLDEVLSTHLALTHTAVETAHAQAQGGAAPPSPRVAEATGRLGNDMQKWDAAIKGGDVQSALDKAFTGATQQGGLSEQEARGGKKALGPAMVIKDGDRTFLAQRVVIPGEAGKPPVIDTYKFAELKEGSTLDAAAQELVGNIRADQRVARQLKGLGAAVGEIAQKPGEALADAGRNIVAEQGPFAFMSGQTRPDMERKIEHDRSQATAKALDSFTSEKDALEKEYDQAWSDCGTKWRHNIEQGQTVERTIKDEGSRRQMLAALDAERRDLKVNGPSSAGEGGRRLPGGPVACAVDEKDASKDRVAIREAYGQALGVAQQRIDEATKTRLAELDTRKASLAQTESVRKQFRRQYFREEFLGLLGPEREKAPILERVKGIDNPRIKAAIVDSYLASSWQGKDKKFYLTGWTKRPMPDKAAAIDWEKPNDWSRTPEFRQWAALEGGDPYHAGSEDRFISQMESLFPLWKKSVFHGKNTVNDEIVRGQVKDWVFADFDKWYEERGDKPKEPRRKDEAPPLVVVKPRPAPKDAAPPLAPPAAKPEEKPGPAGK